MVFKIRGNSFSITPADVLDAARYVRRCLDRWSKQVHPHARRNGRTRSSRVLRLVTRLPKPLTASRRRTLHRILIPTSWFDISEEPVDHAQSDARTLPATNGSGAASLAGPEATGREGEGLRLLVVFQGDEDRWVLASCPTLPGCHSQGRTRGEALDNLREAIRGLPGEHARAWRHTARVVRVSGDRGGSLSWRGCLSSQETSS